MTDQTPETPPEKTGPEKTPLETTPPETAGPEQTPPEMAGPEGPAQKVKRPQQVFTLLIEVGRSEGDGLPKGATGATLMCYATGVDEAEAVREAVAVLKQADLSPLDVSGYGTLEERLAGGDEIDEAERALMTRALAENAVIVAQMEPFFD